MSGPAGAAAAVTTVLVPVEGHGGTGGLLIPAGLNAETSGPTVSDGIYTPTTNREIYQNISSDYQEIVALTNLVNLGRPLPAAEIMLLYEVGMHSRIGPNSRTLRGFARDPRRGEEFPDSVAFYESATFLDSPNQQRDTRSWGSGGIHSRPTAPSYPEESCQGHIPLVQAVYVPRTAIPEPWSRR